MQHGAEHGAEPCEGCGHEVGTGRYCAHCGRAARTGLADDAADPATDPEVPPATDAVPDPVTDPVNDTMVRTIPPVPPVRPRSAPPTSPPPVLPPPPIAARYPLFADDAPHLAVAPARPTTRSHARSTPGWIPWTAAALVLLLVAGLGAVLLVGGGSEPTGGAPANAAPTPEPATSPPTSPADEPTPAQTPAPGAEPTDLARFAEASAPRTAPASADTDGNVTRYEARNMLDGVPTTSWRMPGDGSGTEIVFTLDGPTEVTAVGLVNGYAKTVGSGRNRVDWYAGNRRIHAVEWVFDDGTVVPQDLEEIRSLQAAEVAPVTTGTVTLRLVDVSRPGQGRARRDFTAISDVALVGVPRP